MVFGQGAAGNKISKGLDDWTFQTPIIKPQHLVVGLVRELLMISQGLQRVTPTTTFRTLLIFILKTVITLDSKQSKLGTPSK